MPEQTDDPYSTESIEQQRELIAKLREERDDLKVFVDGFRSRWEDVRSQLQSVRELYDKDRAEWRQMEAQRDEALNECDRLQDRWLAAEEQLARRLQLATDKCLELEAKLDRERIRGDSLRDITNGMVALLRGDLKRIVEEHLGQQSQQLRQVSTVEELDALKVGSVIRRNGVAYMRLWGPYATRWVGSAQMGPLTSEQLLGDRFVIEVLHEAV